VRGLAPGAPLANWTVYALFLLAVAGVLGALVLAVLGARRALSQRD
jgi:hypothetical protein